MLAHKKEATSKIQNYQCNFSNDTEDGLLKILENNAIVGSKTIEVNVRVKRGHFSSFEENSAGESKIRIKYPAPLHFPVPNLPKDKIEKAQLQFEEDLKEFGIFSEEHWLKVLKAINIPAFIAEIFNTDPSSPIGRLSCLFFGCTWIADDLINKQLNGSEATETGFDKISITRFIDNCQGIIDGKSGVSSDYSCAGCPKKSRQLKDLHLLFCRVMNGLKELNPDYYNVPAHRQSFSSSLREWLLACIWFNEDYSNNIQKVSDTSVLFFRKAICGVSTTIEFFAFAKGCYIEEKIRDDLFFKATLDSAIMVVSHLNDLLGILKEFRAHEPDNFLCHMLRKGTSLQMVAEYVENELSGRCIDYLLLSNRLRGIYSNNQNLINYLAIVDRNIVGMLPWYFESTRYCKNTKWENDILHFEI